MCVAMDFASVSTIFRLELANVPNSAVMFVFHFIDAIFHSLPLLEQELFTLPEHPSSPPVFSGIRVTRSLVLYVCFCRTLFVLLYFFFWPLCCLFFFDIRVLIAPLVSSNSSCGSYQYFPEKGLLLTRKLLNFILT
jgi:hypothetical protein